MDDYRDLPKDIPFGYCEQNFATQACSANLSCYGQDLGLESMSMMLGHRSPSSTSSYFHDDYYLRLETHLGKLTQIQEMFHKFQCNEDQLSRENGQQEENEDE